MVKKTEESKKTDTNNVEILEAADNATGAVNAKKTKSDSASDKTKKDTDNVLAIIDLNGKQFMVSKGSLLDCEKIHKEIGEEVIFDKVVLYKNADKINLGEPFLSKATVTGTVVSHNRAKKVIIFKKLRRHGYQRKKGHRQEFTTIRVLGINV